MADYLSRVDFEKNPKIGSEVAADVAAVPPTSPCGLVHVSGLEPSETAPDRSTDTRTFICTISVFEQNTFLKSVLDSQTKHRDAWLG